MKTLTTHKTLLFTVLVTLIHSPFSVADDTEIFLKQSALTAAEIRPNVSFILDTSGSMGLPLDTVNNGTSSYREDNNYDSTISYVGNKNNSGGIGDNNYIYFYARPDTYADQYIYVNKALKTQMTCDISTLNDSTPYATTGDTFLYSKAGDLETTWQQHHMCKEKDASCTFIPASSHLIDCKSEKNHVSTDAYFPASGRGNYLYPVSANFHNYLQGYYRYTVLERVMRDLIDENNDINMSLMRFDGGSGGYVIHESVTANDPTNVNQKSLRQAINDIYEFDDSTPLSEVLWEGYRYMVGKSKDYGGKSVPNAFVSGSTSTYNSPIDYECQKSHLVLLTDGAPTSDGGADSKIEGSSYTGSNCSGNCLDEFAGWIANNGINPRDHSSLTSTQQINVHTIGFGTATNATLLQNTASKGGGLYKTATDANQLTAAFASIVAQTQFEKDTFVAPAVAVNSYTGLQHRDELYFALFQPTNSPRWTGNIKKYKLVDGKIVDNSATPKPAIDAATGYFDPTALSYWTTPTDWDNSGNGLMPDGNNIAWGGAAYELDTPNTRKLYTYIGTPLENTGITPTPVSLSGSQIIDSNTNLTTNNLGLGASTTLTDAERLKIINWSRGIDVDSSSSPLPNNYYVGDLIHNRPSVVTYETTVTKDINGNVTNIAFDDTIYAASNLGFLHALDANTGEELFAYIPQELLTNLKTYYQDTGTFSNKVYGLDAPMTIWRQDTNGNGTVATSSAGIDTPETNDHVYIYQGMRRGGSNLYALDVSKRQDPQLLWQINGQAYNSSPSGNFKDLAQTWSVPQHTKVKWNCNNGVCAEKEVLFFGGGYDTIHDTATSPTTGDKGNAIYMVDAITGALLWSAGKGSYHDLNLSKMENSIPANVTVADIDGDSLADFLFAVDIIGNVWRVDFDDMTTNAADFAYGGRIAQLGGSGADFRRFYNAPDVAYFTQRGSLPFLSISIASGYRASPNDSSINDYLFVIYDNHGRRRPIDTNGSPLYTYVNGVDPIRFSDLGTTATQYGWYKALSGPGEKGLSRTITFNNKILMTTFLPSTTSTCEGSEGNGRYYLFDAFTGASKLPGSVPYSNLAHGGIPPEPAIIFSTDDVCIANCNDGDTTNDTIEARTDLVVCVGTECIDDVLDQTISKSFWREN